MKILLTGAGGYIGKRLLPVLVKNGYDVVCCVRDKKKFHVDPLLQSKIKIAEVDFLSPETLKSIPRDISGAYYLIHSMDSSTGDFSALERQAAQNFRNYMEKSDVRHVVYLGGIANDQNLSRHLDSRREVENILSSGSYALTSMRAGIIIGSGSASFEIIRDLVEKLPVMIAPKWLKTRSQPIAIRDVLMFLEKTLFNEETYNQNFDIGGPDKLTYKEMLLQYAEVRKLKRVIIPVPVFSPKLSSYWLYFITSTSYVLAKKLVDSMKVEVICRDNQLARLLQMNPVSYKKALISAFQIIDQKAILSTGRDSILIEESESLPSNCIQAPTEGCFKDIKKQKINDRKKVAQRVWSIGGKKRWYYANWLWVIRGAVDKLFGGVGLRRGRTSLNDLKPGDTLDFWRVLLADKNESRLLLYAEMKLPGDGWLEFRVEEKELIQTATFRPKGVMGRLYWYALLPFHYFVFNGMINNIANPDS